MLGRRQINVQKENLTTMCRISVKSLLDYACLYTHVDDDCEEFINFCAVFEQLVSHRLRPYQKKVWLPGPGSPRHFWDVLLEGYNKSRGFPLQSCIPNIEAIETLKSAKAKLRAFIRVALMEKRLSDYMYWLLENSSLICESYLDGAILASDEATVLCGDLIGLNAIDFNFCLKGNENELLGPLEINYTPFLKYKQTLASQCSDDLEMLRLSGKDIEENIHSSGILTECNINDVLRLQSLEKNVNQIKEQKDYLEELVRLQERQIKEANTKIDNMKVDHSLAEREWEQECSTMDACILELQAELSKLQKQNDTLKFQVLSLRQFKQRMEMTDVPMVDMAMGHEDREVEHRADKSAHTEHTEDRILNISRIARKKQIYHISSDQKSILSITSDQTSFIEDSHSLVPLAGSLADVSVSASDSESKDYSKIDTIPKIQNNSIELNKFRTQRNMNSESQPDLTKLQEDIKKNSRVDIDASRIPESDILIDDASTLLESGKRSSPSHPKLEPVETATDKKIVAEIGGENKNLDNQDHYINQEIDSKVQITISESFIVMEDAQNETDSLDPLGVQVQNSSTVKDNEAALNTAGIREDGSGDVVGAKDSTGRCGNDVLVREEEALVNPSRASSGSSEGAWEMISDLDNGESKGEN